MGCVSRPTGSRRSSGTGSPSRIPHDHLAGYRPGDAGAHAKVYAGSVGVTGRVIAAVLAGRAPGCFGGFR
jgi:hypothetical protein